MVDRHGVRVVAGVAANPDAPPALLEDLARHDPRYGRRSGRSPGIPTPRARRCVSACPTNRRAPGRRPPGPGAAAHRGVADGRRPAGGGSRGREPVTAACRYGGPVVPAVAPAVVILSPEPATTGSPCSCGPRADEADHGVVERRARRSLRQRGDGRVRRWRRHAASVPRGDARRSRRWDAGAGRSDDARVGQQQDGQVAVAEVLAQATGLLGRGDETARRGRRGASGLHGSGRGTSSSGPRRRSGPRPAGRRRTGRSRRNPARGPDRRTGRHQAVMGLHAVREHGVDETFPGAEATEQGRVAERLPRGRRRSWRRRVPRGRRDGGGPPPRCVRDCARRRSAAASTPSRSLAEPEVGARHTS